jgi:hypothetical protein
LPLTFPSGCQKPKIENQEVEKKKKPTYLYPVPNFEETAESVWRRQLMADLEVAPIATECSSECSSVLVSVGTAAAAGERAPTPPFAV